MENPNFLYHYIPRQHVYSFFKFGLLVRMASDFSSIDPCDTQIPMNTEVEESVFDQERRFLQEGIVKCVREAPIFLDAFESLKFYADDSLKNYPCKLSGEAIYRFTRLLRDYANDERKQLKAYFEFEKEIITLKNKSEYISCWATQEILYDEKKIWEEHGRKGIRLKVHTEKLEKMFQKHGGFIVEHNAVEYQPQETYEKNFKQEESKYDSETRSNWFFIKKNDFCNEREYRFLIKPSLYSNQTIPLQQKKDLYFPEILEIVEEIAIDSKCSPAEAEDLKKRFPEHLRSSLD